ncbi:hypothetical protein [Teredinibacter haidensis]|nr:hypothetical protein [Teredinibacter haidensis]
MDNNKKEKTKMSLEEAKKTKGKPTLVSYFQSRIKRNQKNGPVSSALEQ